MHKRHVRVQTADIDSVTMTHHAADHLDRDLRDPMPHGLVHLQQCTGQICSAAVYLEGF